MQRIIFLAVMALLPSCFAGSVSDTLPDTILNNMEKAADPQGKMLNVKTRITELETFIPAQQIECKSRLFFKCPDKTRTAVSIPGVMETIEIFDGKKSWVYSEGLGVREITGKQLDFCKIIARLQNPNRKIRDIFAKIEVDEHPCTVKNFTCYKLTCHADAALGMAPFIFFIDTGNFMVRKIQMTIFSEMGPVPMETYLEDYRIHDGIPVPEITRSFTLGVETISKLKALEFNKDIPDSEFALPETPAPVPPAKKENTELPVSVMPEQKHGAASVVIPKKQ